MFGGGFGVRELVETCPGRTLFSFRTAIKGSPASGGIGAIGAMSAPCRFGPVGGGTKGGGGGGTDELLECFCTCGTRKRTEEGTSSGACFGTSNLKLPAKRSGEVSKAGGKFMDCDKLIGIGNLGTDKASACGGALMLPGRDSGIWDCAFGIGDGV